MSDDKIKHTTTNVFYIKQYRTVELIWNIGTPDPSPYPSLVSIKENLNSLRMVGVIG